MLKHVHDLYGDEIDTTDWAITQGSNNNDVSASFGTQAGGGAVDLSVLSRDTYQVLTNQVNPLLYALRIAGFAAWLRGYGELGKDSPIHIHTIVIGDQKLSEAAQEQLNGIAGYFRGYGGLLVDGSPTIDRFGGPVIRQWMFDLSYRHLHEYLNPSTRESLTVNLS